MEYYENNMDISRVVAVRAASAAEGLSSAYTELSRDFILPDTYSDIKRIIWFSGRLIPDSGYCDLKKAYYGGKAVFKILFVTDEGNVRSLEVSSDYEGSVQTAKQDDESKGDTEAVFMPFIESLSVRAVNPRKVGIKAKISSGVFAWNDIETSVGFGDSVTELDKMSFEEKCEKLSYIKMKSFSASNIESGDDIRIDDTAYPIKEIVMTDITFSSISSKARDGAIAFNADADVVLAYTYDDIENSREGVRFLKHKIPISYLIEEPTVTEKALSVADVYLSTVSAATADNAEGVAKVIELDFSYSVNISAAIEEEAEIVKDIYSTLYETEALFSDIRYSSSAFEASKTLKCSGEVNFGESGEILASIPSAKITSVESVDGALTVFGNAYSSNLIVEEDNSTVLASVEIPFSAVITQTPSQKLEYICRVGVSESTSFISNGKTGADISLTISLIGWENRKENIVSSVALLSGAEEVSKKPFTVYYPAKGESVWDIAKKYKVTRSSLVMANSEKGSFKEGKKAIIIPKNKKPAFNGIIQ